MPEFLLERIDLKNNPAFFNNEKRVDFGFSGIFFVGIR